MPRERRSLPHPPGSGRRAGAEQAEDATGKDVRTGKTEHFGEKVGPGTSNVEFITPFIGDHLMTFRLADGQFVTHSKESVAPSVLHPGLFHAGIHPGENNIVPELSRTAFLIVIR